MLVWLPERSSTVSPSLDDQVWWSWEGDSKSNGVNPIWTYWEFPGVTYCYCTCCLICFMHLISKLLLFCVLLALLVDVFALIIQLGNQWYGDVVLFCCQGLDFPTASLWLSEMTWHRLFSVSFGNGENSLVSREGTFRLIEVEHMIVFFF